MSPRTQSPYFLWYLAWVCFLLAACAANPTLPPITVTASLSPEIHPFSTSTPSQTPEPFVDLTPIPITPAPTATPFTHKVAKGETMLGIALRYGIKLEDLLAANPTVNPRIMSVDTLLIVPLTIEDAEPTPTITPPPLTLMEPRCYPAMDQDLVCLVEVQNTMEQAVENVSVWVGLLGGDQLLASQVVVPALNILYPGEHIVLQASFPGPLPAVARPRAELLTALGVAEDDPRYLPAQAEILQVEISSNGLLARVSGRIRWQQTQLIPAVIWVSVQAYDALGLPVGVRKLETRPSCTQNGADAPCSFMDVEMVVYSLGPVIQIVEVLAEARP